MSRQCRRRGESDEAVEAARNILDPNVLTIGFARRFATYKRAALIMTDPDWLAEIVNDPQRPMQIIFAGKAHPADEPGKQIIQRIANLRHDPRFAGRIAFVEDYDINVCRHMIQGVDVWLNNPRRPLEASGTSGQKAVLNGALNLSILDGWWAEAYDGTNGFAIGKGTAHVDDRITDDRDGRRLAARADRRSHSALLRPRHRRPAAALDQADDELDQLAGLAVQRRPHGGRLRPPRLPPRRRRRKLRYEYQVEVGAGDQRSGAREITNVGAMPTLVVGMFFCYYSRSLDSLDHGSIP